MGRPTHSQNAALAKSGVSLPCSSWRGRRGPWQGRALKGSLLPPFPSPQLPSLFLTQDQPQGGCSQAFFKAEFGKGEPLGNLEEKEKRRCDIEAEDRNLVSRVSSFL